MTATRAGAAPPAEHPTGRPGDAAAPPSVPAQERAAPPPSGLPQLARLVGVIAAPTTLLTALMFYFGWSHAYWFFEYFGVHSTLLDLTTRDYLQRSFDGLFVPMAVAACAGLAALWGNAALRNHLAAGAHPPALRLLVPVAAAGGLLLAVGGFSSIFTTTVLDRHLAWAPLSLAFGVLLVLFAVHLRRAVTASARPGRTERPQWVTVAEWAAVFVLLGLSLFWAANDYAAAVGRSRARQFVAGLPTYPSAVVYSAHSLNLSAPGVRETRCRDQEASYRFRYDGLKLMLQSGNQYVFLPQAWSPSDGVAIVLPRNDSLRLEFLPATAPALQHPTC